MFKFDSLHAKKSLHDVLSIMVVIEQSNHNCTTLHSSKRRDPLKMHVKIFQSSKVAEAFPECILSSMQAMVE
jgi:hypothetical protein